MTPPETTSPGTTAPAPRTPAAPGAPVDAAAADLLRQLRGFAGTHVWNYTIGSVDTTPLKPEGLSAFERERAALPGMMAGSVGDENEYFFESQINGNSYRYWVRFDRDGTVTDYAYLTDDVPDFVWTQHTKNAWTDRWTGESQAPGVRNEDVQRVYVAFLGGFKAQTLPGGFIAAGDLRSAAAVKPDNI